MSRRKRTTLITIGTATTLATVIAALAWIGDNDRPDETNHPTPGTAAPSPNRHPQSASAQTGPVIAPLIEASRTEDPRILGRRIAETIYGVDYRDSRDAYIDAIWAVSLGADTDQHEAWTAFAEDPALTGMVELVPDADAWARMAKHDQRSVFDVREPVGAAEIEIDAELTEAGVTTTVVLVTGTQRVLYTGDDGATQAHTVQPSLQMLIGCTPGWDGCRLLRVLDRQP